MYLQHFATNTLSKKSKIDAAETFNRVNILYSNFYFYILYIFYKIEFKNKASGKFIEIKLICYPILYFI